MKLTTKGRFAVTAMLDLALCKTQELVTIAEIGERRHLSSSYLEQLFGKLRRAALVEGMRGPNGGYRLARDASKITVAQILDAVDDSLKTQLCEGGRPHCDGEGECITYDLWESLNQQMRKFLEGISLKDLADKKKLADQGVHTIKLSSIKRASSSRKDSRVNK